MKKLTTTVFTLVFVILLNLPAQAQPSVRIGVVDIPPLGFGNAEGEQADWWREIARRTGLTFQIETLPLKRLRSALVSGRIDAAIFGPGKEPAYNTRELMLHQTVYFSLFSRIDLESPAGQKAPPRVAAILGATGFADLASRNNFETVFVRSYKGGLQMLQSGRIDGFYGIEKVVSFNFKEHMKKDPSIFHASFPPSRVVSVHNMVRVSAPFAARNPQIVGDIIKIGHQLAAEGFVAERERYYLTPTN